MRRDLVKHVGDGIRQKLPAGSSYAVAVVTCDGVAYRFEGEAVELVDIVGIMAAKLDAAATKGPRR